MGFLLLLLGMTMPAEAMSLDRREAIRAITEAYSLAEHHSSQSLIGYLHHIVIDSRPEPTAFRLKADPWQWAMQRRVHGALERVAGLRPDYQGPRFFWFTLPRGHDKTSFVGRDVNWLLAYTKKPVNIACAAGDREQADFLSQFMRAEARLNPWLDRRLNFQNYKVLGQQDSKLWILAADAATSFGNKPDVIVLDELTHWESRELFDALMSGTEKRPHCVVIVITNAGLLRTWQHDVVEYAKLDPAWSVYEAPGPIASWMSAEGIERLARMLPKQISQRVFYNKWQDASEGLGFITRAEAEQCVANGKAWGIQREEQGQRGAEYYAGIDYGPKKDRTVLCVVKRLSEQRLACVKMDVMQGHGNERVLIEDVERWMIDVHKRFLNVKFNCDPYQMESTLQKMPSYGLVVERFETRAGKGNYELAANLHSLAVNGQLGWYEGCGNILVKGRSGDLEWHSLVDEICDVILKQMAYGYRIDHEETKHDDRVIALGQACLLAVQQPVLPMFRFSEQFF
jgi:hypothetical protein